MNLPPSLNLPLGACFAGLVAYQLALKFWPRSLNPLRGLAAAYLLAALLALACSFALDQPADAAAPPHRASALWPLLLLAAATVAIEAGYIALFRRGAGLATLGPYAGAAATVTLAAVGAFYFRESLGLRGWLGLAACLAGSLLLSGK